MQQHPRGAGRRKRQSRRQPPKRWLSAVEADALELADRLELGDNESVRAWFLHKYPDTVGRIVRNGDWEEFLGAVREISQMSPGEFERAMRRVLQEHAR